MNQRNGVEPAGGELRFERAVIDRLAPLDPERLGFLPAAARDFEPFVGKSAAHAAEDALPNDIADRCLHHSPGRGSGKENRLSGAEEFLQTRMDLAIEFLERFAPMANHGPGKSGERFRRNLDRAGSEKLVV